MYIYIYISADPRWRVVCLQYSNIPFQYTLVPSLHYHNIPCYLGSKVPWFPGNLVY